MATYIIGKEISAPIWGGHKPALLTTFGVIENEDGTKTQALYFYAVKNCCSLSDEQLNNCRFQWYVITETLDEISD